MKHSIKKQNSLKRGKRKRSKNVCLFFGKYDICLILEFKHIIILHILDISLFSIDKKNVKTHSLQRLFTGSQLLKQLRAYSKEVATGQLANLASVTERCAHHLGLVAELLVVVVHASDR